jgi:hypothetical protein
MSKLKANIFRRRLAKLLSIADDEEFIQLCWAVDAIQSGRQDQARRYLKFSREDAVDSPASPRLVFKWAIETLVNEALTTRKAKLNDGANRRLDCSKFDGIVGPFNALRLLENEEYGLYRDPEDVREELSRIGFRQFPWQRELFTLQNMARPMKLFAGEHAQRHFENKYGIPIQEFVLGGFAIWLQLRETPFIAKPSAVREVGLTKETFERVQNIISLPLEDVRKEASLLRRGHGQPIAYKPSILRRYPCIAFENGKRTRAPLVNLVLDRITSGLYYDVITAGGDVPREIGSSFEEYCFELVALTFSDLDCGRETQYTNGIDTPDFFVFRDDTCQLVAECKAKRMTVAARFGEDPVNEAAIGYDEMGKGVFQIWRHFSYVRRGLLPDQTCAPEALGVVLTLDPWLQMTADRYDHIISIAETKAAGDPNILPEDKRRVAFCSIEDLENMLATATFDSLIEVLNKAASSEFAGHLLAGLHADLEAPKVEPPRDYAFENELDLLLPWWGRIPG